MSTEPAKLLEEEGFSYLTCIQCGTCTGSCPSGRYTSLNTRRIVLLASRNMDVYHDEDLWIWLMHRAGKNQEWIADKMGITQSAISHRKKKINKFFKKRIIRERRYGGSIVRKN